MDVYLASGNAHKLTEIVDLVDMAGLSINVQGADSVGGMPDVDESGDTLEENARIKAKALLDKVPSGAWVLSDDSGLLVDALNGEPGVHSARYAGPGGNATANNLKLLHALRDFPMEQRTARFSCVLYFARAGHEGISFRGDCEGHIMTAPSGEKGFGYDPLFCPLGYAKTFADLGSSVKNSLSHRAKAVAQWTQAVQAMGD